MKEQNLDIIYLGSFPTSRMISSSNGRIDSLYRDDQALIRGLRSVEGVSIKVITIPDIGSYPSNPLFISGFYDEQDDVYSLPIFNFPVIKLLWTVSLIFCRATRIINHTQGRVYVFTPYIVFHHILPACLLKLFFRKRIKLVLVTPDIFFPKSLLSKLLNKWSEQMAQKYDAFILYTLAMADLLGVKEKPHIVIEGFKEIVPHVLSMPEEKFVIQYSGSLNLEYGLGRLVDAMDFIRAHDVEMHLYGDGNAVDYIKKRSQEDIRIKYKGRVSKKEALEALYKANVLVNPRNSEDGEYVAYSFPSKDIDYLGTGIPSVLCKLPGMPEDYYGFFIDAGNGTPQELAASIQKVYMMSMDERVKFGKKAEYFIEQRMDTHNQGLRIISMLNQIQ